MRIGIDAGASSIECAQKNGVAGVPVSSRALLEESTPSLLGPIRDAGLSVCQINAMGYNPLHPDPDNRAASREAVLNALERSSELGCPWISINGGNYHPSGFLHGDKRNYSAVALEEIAGELEPLLKTAERAGAYLTIEPYIKGAISSAERFLTLQSLLGTARERLRINLDVTSFYDLQALIDPDPVCDALCRDLADSIGLIHIKEIALSESFHIHADLVPVTEGPTDWERVLRRSVPSAPVDSWIVIEHVQSEDEAKASVEYIGAICRRLSLPVELPVNFSRESPTDG